MSNKRLVLSGLVVLVTTFICGVVMVLTPEVTAAVFDWLERAFWSAVFILGILAFTAVGVLYILSLGHAPKDRWKFEQDEMDAFMGYVATDDKAWRKLCGD